RAVGLERVRLQLGSRERRTQRYCRRGRSDPRDGNTSSDGSSPLRAAAARLACPVSRRYSSNPPPAAAPTTAAPASSVNPNASSTPPPTSAVTPNAAAAARLLTLTRTIRV